MELSCFTGLYKEEENKLLDEKKLKEIENRIKQYISEDTIKLKEKQEHVDFFLKNSENSRDSAKALFELSTDADKQEYFGFTSFNGLLWVVNASYYSMFYMARALLENEGIKIKSDLSIHGITFDCLIKFFYLNGRLQKKLIESFIKAKEDAAELLGKQKADKLVEEYYFEKKKRAAFTYETTEIVIRTRAETSLKRATEFSEEIRNMIS